ncbi:DUF4136 domain-containing protein [Spirosoma taeanense]|uniref:DUF4136 domain-containing protein n=1 Tax=Spirosoma taeanense TaxID=2735870 RepID=A0A6M5YDK0_9BACT|nr:DUF4136 domain-containing protein [Spirosoma taeanense]QJW91380.1 DUF4136 domain-containing protein [Spirosoma taeanense]
MKQFLMVAGLLTVIYSCSPRVTVDSNSRVNFNKYKTFAWMDSDVKAGQNPLYYNQLATESVENTMAKVLQDKGLQQVESRPDLLVGYHFFVEDKTRTVAQPVSPIYGPYLGWGRWGYAGWGPGWWGWGGQQYVQQEYQSGTLVVDMVDARTHQLVWRGSIQNAVADPARITAQLTREVERITEKFPDRNS